MLNPSDLFCCYLPQLHLFLCIYIFANCDLIINSLLLLSSIKFRFGYMFLTSQDEGCSEMGLLLVMLWESNTYERAYFVRCFLCACGSYGESFWRVVQRFASSCALFFFLKAEDLIFVQSLDATLFYENVCMYFLLLLKVQRCIYWNYDHCY